MKTIDVIASVLLIIGGINWGLIGFFNFNLVGGIFGGISVVSRIIYAIVGICAIYEVVEWKAMQRRWSAVPA